MSISKWPIPVALGLSLLLWVSSNNTGSEQDVWDIPSAVVEHFEPVVLHGVPPETHEIQPVREREVKVGPEALPDPLRSRIAGLGMTLNEGHELAWEAGVECLATRLGQESVDALVELSFTSDLGIDETIVVASILTRMQDQREERIPEFSDRAYVRIRRSLKGGRPTSNDARDLASWRAAAGFGSFGEVAHLLDTALAAEKQPRYLKALEVAPSLEVAMAMVDWDDSGADSNLLEWMRFRSWVLDPPSREVMADKLVQRATNGELKMRERESTIPILVLMGFETTEAAFMRALKPMKFEYKDVKPLVLAMYKEWPTKMIRESHVPGMLKRMSVRDRELRAAQNTAWGVLRGRLNDPTSTQSSGASFQDAVDETESQVERGKVAARLALMEPEELMPMVRSVVKTENRAAITLAIMLVADRGTIGAHDWLAAQLEHEPMMEHHLFLQAQRVRLRALLGMPLLVDRPDDVILGNQR
jgi:hypothetical protein